MLQNWDLCYHKNLGRSPGPFQPCLTTCDTTVHATGRIDCSFFSELPDFLKIRWHQTLTTWCRDVRGPHSRNEEFLNFSATKRLGRCDLLKKKIQNLILLYYSISIDFETLWSLALIYLLQDTMIIVHHSNYVTVTVPNDFKSKNF